MEESAEDALDCILRAVSICCATVIVSNVNEQNKSKTDKQGVAEIEAVAESFYRYMLDDQEIEFRPQPDKLPKKSA